MLSRCSEDLLLMIKDIKKVKYRNRTNELKYTDLFHSQHLKKYSHGEINESLRYLRDQGYISYQGILQDMNEQISIRLEHKGERFNPLFHSGKSDYIIKNILVPAAFVILTYFIITYFYG
jgi:hypothetical protein